MAPDLVELLCTSTPTLDFAAQAQLQQLQQQQQMQQLQMLQLQQLQQLQHQRAGWHLPPYLPSPGSAQQQAGMAVPQYAYPASQAVPGSPAALAPQLASPGGDATRQVLIGVQPAAPAAAEPATPANGIMTSWALEERLKAKQARAQQEAWAESMRAQYLGVTPPPPAHTPSRSSPEKETPQKEKNEKQDVCVAFDRLLLLSKLGAAWDQHQATFSPLGGFPSFQARRNEKPTKQVEGRTKHPAVRQKATEAAAQNEDESFKTPTKKVARQPASLVAPRWRTKERASEVQEGIAGC